LSLIDQGAEKSRSDPAEGLLPGLEWAVKQILAAAPQSPSMYVSRGIYREMAALLESHAQAIREHARVVAEGSL
jgi:hypothetical protein